MTSVRTVYVVLTECSESTASLSRNINNDLIRLMYNCFEIVNGPMWISWANSLYTVNLKDSHHVSHITLLLFIYYYIFF